ncbi:MAG: amidase [Pseudomonadota bacterium]
MTPIERFENYRQQIQANNPSLNAFLEMRLDAARAEAEDSRQRLENDETLSAIDGLCVGVKANTAVAGLPCHGGIDAYRDNISERDAVVIQRLKAAGAVILGNLNMHEGALGATTDNQAFGRCRNPHRSDFTPGGSSGGSGAAIAARLCDMAIGTDTMGSIRIPAAYCGVQGHKPSTGFVPTEGVMPLSTTLDHIGPLCATVDELASMLAVMSAQSTNGILEARNISEMKIGVWTGEGTIYVEASVATGFEDAVKALQQSGAKLTPIAPPIYETSRSRRAGLIVSEVEGHKFHHSKLIENPSGFSDEFRSLLEWGASRADEKLQPAYDHISDIQSAAVQLWNEVDLVLAPVAPQQAFAFDDPVPANQADFTAWADFARLPATAIFTGMAGNGLPLSFQVIGPEGADFAVLAAAKAFEQVFGAPLSAPDFS